MAVNYVKFYRGTPLAFKNVIKNEDTLYFITNSDSKSGLLYLGDKLIGGGVSSLEDLENILLTELSDNQILVYDESSESWVNKSLTDAIGLMIGATATSQGANGLVPAPGMGQQDLFLRGDGTWAAPTGSAVDLQADGKTIEVFDEITLSLKDFGQQYYKYIVASGSEEEGNYVAAHYELQIVDDSNPWKEGLEPKVVKENGQLVLGWFEPNTTTLEGLQDQVVILSTAVSDLNSLLTNNYYTKEETDNLIAAELAKVDHLSRKVFDSIEDAEFFISAEEHPEQYIYMILASATGQSEQDKYDEYMYLDGALEKVGSWETDLSDYAKKTDLDNYVEKIDGYSLISIANIEKLEGIEAGAQKNLFDSINVNDFFIDENRQLNLQPLLISDIENLENILNTQSEDINSLNTEITNLNELIVNNYVLKTEYEEDISIIMSSLVWQSLTEE